MKYLILEHPGKGLVTDTPQTSADQKYHFRWSIPRNHDDVFRIYDIVSARYHRDQVQKQVGPNQAVVIRRSPDWEAMG